MISTRLNLFPFLLLVVLCVASLAGSAPVPSSASLTSFDARDEDLAFLFVERALLERSLEPVHEDVFLRDVVPQVEFNELVRRKSIFNKIKDAFKKAGKAIKKGFQKVGKGIKNVAKKIGNGIKKAAKKVGNGIKNAAKKVGNGIKNAAKKVGSGIKKAAQKVGKGIKTAAKKVGKFVKDTGAKIAKFGLQIVSTAQSIGSKIAKFIPGIGKPISAALNGASKLTGLAAKKTPANLGKKLEKGFKVMDKIKNPVGGAAGAALNALRRDIDGETDVLKREYLEEIDARDATDEDWLLERDVEEFMEREYDDIEELDARDTVLEVDLFGRGEDLDELN